MIINPFSQNLIQGFAFPVSEFKWSSDIQQEIQYVAMSGSAVMVFRSYNQKSVGMSYGYAHAKMNPNVGISLSFSGSGVGVDVSFGLTKEYTVVGKAIDTHYYS